jgi:hypothetical protein
MTPLEILSIANELEAIGQRQVRLAELVLQRQLEAEVKHKLHTAAVRDNFGMVFKTCPDVTFYDLFLALSLEEKYSDDAFFSGQTLGYLPTEDETKNHYSNPQRPSKYLILLQQLQSAS